MPLSFSALRESLARLHVDDPKFLTENGLRDLSKLYAAYPMLLGSARVCILIPKGTSPREASRMTESAMRAKQIMALEQATGRWARAWPLSAELESVEAKPAPAPAGDDWLEIQEE